MPSADPCSPTNRSSWRHSLLATQVWKRGFSYGLPAGLLQAALNQGDAWIAGHVTGVVIAKTILSPLVGFAVAYLAAVTTHHESSRRTLPSSVVSDPQT